MLSSSYLLACDTVLLTRKFYEVIPINSFWIIELIEYYFFFFWPGHVTWKILVSSLEIEPVPHALETQNLYHWIAGGSSLQTLLREAKLYPRILLKFGAQGPSTE